MKKILDKIEVNRKRLSSLLKNRDNHIVLNKWLKTELAYTSNAIEGNTLTRRETALAIEENITSSTKPINYYLEARNHAIAYDFVVEQAKRNIKINEAVILQIHKLILSGIDDLSAGSYRSVRVRIAGSMTVLPNPLKVPELMKDFNHWLITARDSGIDKALEAHYRLVTIHPFTDGNGRTARLLMNLILLKNGCGPLIIRPIDRRRYLLALEARQTQTGGEPYLNFMLRALNRSLKTFIEMLDINKEDVDLRRLLTVSKFAKLAGIPISTIRYWVQTGKLKPATHRDSGYMLFDPKQKEDIRKQLSPG